jgi:glycosyltransferase involved in cell wall biosynthesis
LPAYNEDQVIASTVCDVLDVLSAWRVDAEVLVVNDGSTDRTGANPRVIARAFRELFISARKWRRVEQAHAQHIFVSEHRPY